MLLLSHAQLLLQRLGHLGGRGAGQAEGNLQHNVKCQILRIVSFYFYCILP